MALVVAPWPMTEMGARVHLTNLPVLIPPQEERPTGAMGRAAAQICVEKYMCSVHGVGPSGHENVPCGPPAARSTDDQRCQLLRLPTGCSQPMNVCGIR